MTEQFLGWSHMHPHNGPSWGAPEHTSDLRYCSRCGDQVPRTHDHALVRLAEAMEKLAEALDRKGRD